MRTAIIVSLALLSACSALPEAQVRTGLMRAGLPRPLASCMAGRMVDRLSLIQLRRLGDLPRANTNEPVDKFLHHVRALGDPEILGVTTSSAALCATGFAR